MNSELEKYLDKFEKYLKVLLASQRIDIVKDVKNEIVKLSGSGFSPEEIENQLGKPKALARTYIADEIGKMKKFSWKKFAMFFSF